MSYEFKKVATEDYVDKSISSIGNGTQGVYDSLTALQTAFPNGTSGIYVTSDNGHWYYYNNGWQDGGVYQTDLRYDELKSDLDNYTRKVNISKNIFNGTFDNGYISNGRFISDSSIYCTSSIHLVPGYYLYHSNPNLLGDNATKVFVYDGESYIGEIPTKLIDSTRNIYKFSLNKEYDIRINVGNIYNKNKFMLVRGSTLEDYPNTYEPYISGKKFEEGVHLNDVNKGDIQKLTNPLYGKKISVTGDSICYGNGYTGGYAKIIANNNNMTMQNVAVGGATIVPQDGRFDISASVTSLDEDSDYIILEGGVNDSSISSIELGVFSNSFDLPTSRDTFYNCLDYMLYNLTHRFSGKKYGFIIVHQMTRKLGSMFGDEATFYNAILKCCKKWGVPVCDLNVNCPPFGLLPSDDLLRITYTTNNDGWHPTEECYTKYYVPKIEAWLKTL